MNVGSIKHVAAAAFKIQGPYLSTVGLSKKRQTVVCFFSEGFTQKAPLWWPGLRGSCPSYVVLKLKYAVFSLPLLSWRGCPARGSQI